MKTFWLLFCAGLLLCAALLGSPAAAPEVVPFETAAPKTAAPTPLPAAAHEGGTVQKADALNAALETLVNFGPEEAGSSLKTALASAALLNWAEDNAVNSPIDAITRHAQQWLSAKSGEDQALFWQNWPQADDLAQALCRDIGTYQSLMDSAGDPLTYGRYTPAKYERLRVAVENLLEDA